MPNLSLEETKSGFVLSGATANGRTKTSVLLNEDDIITLAQSLPPLRDRILARQSRPGAEAIAMTPVAQIALNVDFHKSEVHLLMIDRHGARTGFALPPEIARELAERLPVRLDEIDVAMKVRPRQ